MVTVSPDSESLAHLQRVPSQPAALDLPGFVLDGSGNPTARFGRLFLLPLHFSSCRPASFH